MGSRIPASIAWHCCSDGELADADMRRHLGREGLRRLTEVRLDDLYIYNDSDEIPRAELLLFLKLHDGYSGIFKSILYNTPRRLGRLRLLSLTLMKIMNLY